MFKASTLLLFAYYIYRFIKPININRYKALLKKVSAKNFKITDLEESEKTECAKLVSLWVILFIQQVFEFTYLLFALNHDIYKVPTIAMVIWFVVMFAKSKPNKDVDALFTKMESPTYKFKSKVISIIDILYFGYMLYLTVL